MLSRPLEYFDIIFSKPTQTIAIRFPNQLAIK